jgi:hypothetical protein
MVKQELERFLLDWQNVVWFPEHIYYDLEENRLFFLYIPYYEEDSGFAQFMEFLIEKVDYDDEDLVNCVYHMYERYENCGESYLQKQIFNDIEEVCSKQRERLSLTESILIAEKLKRGNRADEEAVESVESDVPSEESCEEKRGLLGFFDAIRRKKSVQLEVSDWNADRAGELRMVAEQNAYEGESYGKTVFVELRDEFGKARGLYYPDGKLLYYIEETHVVGKMKGEADIVLDDASISRMHARITKREGKYYLEDLNSTNGTYKNGIRLQPYEEKELEEGDDVRFGRVLLVFR